MGSRIGLELGLKLGLGLGSPKSITAKFGENDPGAKQDVIFKKKQQRPGAI